MSSIKNEWAYSQEIASKWQSEWEHNSLYTVSQEKLKNAKNPYYVLVEFPYPSGEGLHIGHTRPYTGMDVVARYKRMKGFDVLYPIGFDSFGVSAERYSLKIGKTPQKMLEITTKKFTDQLKMMGYSFDYSRIIKTSDPSFYKWTQWMFIQFYKQGLAYKSPLEMFWCDECKMSLTHEDLEKGACERCKNPVERRVKEQWNLKITQYADELIDDLKKVDYPSRISTEQINWIGKNTGFSVDFKVKNSSIIIKTFTTRVDTIFGVSFIAIAPEFMYTKKWLEDENNDTKDWCKQLIKERLDPTFCADKKINGKKLNSIVCIHPITGKELPVFIADYVIGNYGTKAVMGVPAHDDRDYKFADFFQLEILPIIESDTSSEAWTKDGRHINSSYKNILDINGLNIEESKKKISSSKLEGIEETTQYKLQDWGFARQRYWGEPIPMVYCEKCGWEPLPIDQLPLILPPMTDYKPTEEGDSPLAKMTDWVKTSCPKCKGYAERETDTMPTWAGSSWYFMRYLDNNNDKEFVAESILKKWLPVSVYNGGMEHTTRHLLYSRFWYKAMKDGGSVFSDEPYTKRTFNGLILAEGGIKMSKSLGNTISPEDLVSQYGTDISRLYILFLGDFEQSTALESSSIVGLTRFLQKVERFSRGEKFVEKNSSKVSMVFHTILKSFNDKLEGHKFNVLVANLMEIFNSIEREGCNKKMFEDFLKILSPFAPHFTEELWHNLGNETFISKENFPLYIEKYTRVNSYILPIQINGKLRGNIEIDIDADEEKIKATVLNSSIIERHNIVSSKIKKWIILPNKIVNIIGEF
ncbi:MAG: leucine--tRNA ligase [Alphaproteobacteria bacterium]|nr:leucine--tRNA ligase [Alphaproteobacteria bacterium]MBL0717721.1 leucine--tRNA ligase [Alphaproteobacteria bacterium]